VTGLAYSRRAAAMLMLLSVATATGGIDYVADTDTLCVRDYPPERPCTPGDLVRADSAFGWGKVEHDPDGDVWIVRCNLRIGKNDGSSTYFQVGSARHPRQTLHVHGNVRVYPTWLPGQNAGTWRLPRSRGIVNRLTLGVSGSREIGGVLLIGNARRQGRTLVVGGFEGYLDKNSGGQLCVYNGRIAACGSVPIGSHTKRNRPVFMGGKDRLELVDAAIANVAGLALGKRLTEGTIVNCRFENCGTALQAHYQKEVTGCTFANCGTAVVSASRNPMVLRDCTFTGNRCNWSVPYHALILIDCTVDDPSKGRYAAERETFAVSKRHVVVRVVHPDGRPARGAVVQAVPDGEPPFPRMDLLSVQTGRDGCTPGKGATGSLLLTEWVIRAPRAPDASGRPTPLTYTIKATAGQSTGIVERFVPSESWGTVTVRLRRATDGGRRGQVSRFKIRTALSRCRRSHLPAASSRSKRRSR